MTRYDFKIAVTALAIVVMLGLVIGFAVGSFSSSSGSDTQILAAPPPEPAVFDGTMRDDGGPPSVAGIPGWSDLYVNDYQDLLDDDAEAQIRAQLVELYNQTGVEMSVLTIPDMITYGWSGGFEAFATELFNAWGIGTASRNDGVLVLVSRFDRQMRIELGSGYGTDRDADMQAVIDTHFLPAFAEDAYQQGITKGVEETIFEIAGRYPGTYDQSTVQRGWGTIARRAAEFGLWVLAPLLALLGGGALAVRRYLRRRPRPCPDCRTTMRRAGEAADDAHLDGGQRLEEYLGSVDYDVWHCPACAHISIHGYKAWGGAHSACPECRYRTLETTSEVLEPATRTSTGTKRLDYTCKNCDHRDSETRTIAMISDANASGSGGGSSRSSFGGGSSSGGGASGSW